MWSYRVGKSLEDAVAWCRENDLEFDAVNDNLPEVIKIYGPNSRKISSDYYIDDRALFGLI